MASRTKRACCSPTRATIRRCASAGWTASARGWLTDRTLELLGGTHAYWLPFETILTRTDRFETMTGEDLVSAIHEDVRKRQSTAAPWDPIPDGHDYPVPPPDDAIEMARARFELFFALQQEAG